MLHERALLVTLSLSMFSPKKTDKRITKKVTDEHHADAGMLRVTKTILPDEAIEPIRKVRDEIRDYHWAHTLPWGENNERLLNSAFYLDYVDRVRALTEQFNALADEFVRHYPTYIDNARAKLNGAFNAKDYPSDTAIRDKFGVRLEFKPVPAGGDFRITCGEEAMEALRLSVDARVAEAEIHARRDLAKRIAEPLAHLVTRLTEEDASLHESVTANLRRICDLIPTLNVTGDARLEEIRQQIHRDLYRADTETLKENPTIRASTARKAQDILDTMQAFFPTAA